MGMLIERQTLLEKVVNASNEGILILNQDGEITLANKYVGKMLSIASSEIVGHSIWDILPDFNIERGSSINAVNLNIGDRSLQVMWRSTINEELGFPEVVFLNEHQASMNAGLEHQKTQESLLESNRKYFTLINNLPGVVYWCLDDEDWTMQYLNKNVEKLTGYRHEQFFDGSGLSFNSIIHPEDRIMVKDAVNKAISEGKSYEITYRIITASNEEKWVWEQGAKTQRANHKKHSLEGYIMDVTLSKKADEILIENENRLKNYASNLEREVKLRTNEVVTTMVQMAEVNLFSGKFSIAKSSFVFCHSQKLP